MRVKYLFVGFVILASCHTASNKKQFDNEAYTDSVYSMIASHFQEEADADSISWSEDYIPFTSLGISGKTFEEIKEIYGSPSHCEIMEFDPLEYWGDAVNYRDVQKVFRDCQHPVTLYTYYWGLASNPDIRLIVFFLRVQGVLRAIYGIQENMLIYNME